MRDWHGRLMPGHTANPGGKPKRVREVQALASEETIDAFRRVIAMAKNPSEDSKVRHACDKLIIAYGIGEPQKTIDIDTGRSDDGLDSLTVEELRALAKQSLVDEAAPETDDDGDDEPDEAPH